MNERRVAITGVGALTPIGNNVPEFWRAALSGKSGAAPITRFDASNLKTGFACQIKDFVPQDHLTRKEIRTNDPYVQYALVAVAEALSDAALRISDANSGQTSVIWGSGNGGFQSFEKEVSNYAKTGGTPHFSPYFIPRSLVNMAAGLISIKYGIKGPALSTVSACATGNSALIEAYYYIKAGRALTVIAGGSDAMISHAAFAGFNAIKALSTKNDDPERASRPFDKDRDGFVIGEGAGAIILEDMEHAEARGAKIYAELAGGAMTSDAYHITASQPEGEGAERAIREALKVACLNVEDVDYINAHATSTPLGDLSEAYALSRVFEESSVSVSATKSMTGHLLGAAGAVEAILAIKTIEEGRIAPTINTLELDAKMPARMDIVLEEPKKRHVNVALSNNFGFGGHNAVVLFRKYSS